MSQQVAVITGAAGGFGAAITRTLLDIGYQVAATDISASRLEQLHQQLGQPEGLHRFTMDVTQFDSVNAAAQTIAGQLGSTITALVNNAGVIERSYCLSARGLRDTEKVMAVNLTGAFNCTEVFARYMARLKYGRIINIASVAGIWGAAGGSAYAASKAGLISATESWARELGPMNISVYRHCSRYLPHRDAGEVCRPAHDWLAGGRQDHPQHCAGRALGHAGRRRRSGGVSGQLQDQLPQLHGDPAGRRDAGRDAIGRRHTTTNHSYAYVMRVF
ncbi:SDR family NAD(P)-dependent oxidoreductase [Dickeya fangzhongdai]|uniref:SDR family NAD(P)-dependent oxidoreductase n=1 Tax=Dickeya fangzhongdai TaxID=1778540 RepID=UPI003F5D1F82